MDINELKPNRNNPRKMSPENLAKLARSIERDPEFMVLKPIVIDEDNNVVAGNQRLKACQYLGYEEIPDEWVVQAVALSEEKLRRFALIDNAPEGISGEWDMEMLSLELHELEERFQINPKDIGLDSLNFSPNLSPETGNKKVTEGDMNRGHDQLENQFKDGDIKTITLMCPHCNEEFGMQDKHLKLMIEK